LEEKAEHFDECIALEKDKASGDKKADVLEEIVGASPLARQQMSVSSKDKAIDDLLYILPKALSNQSISLSDYLRVVRKLSREQFIYRATSLRVFEKQKELCGDDLSDAPSETVSSNDKGVSSVSTTTMDSGARPAVPLKSELANGSNGPSLSDQYILRNSSFSGAPSRTSSPYPPSSSGTPLYPSIGGDSIARDDDDLLGVHPLEQQSQQPEKKAMPYKLERFGDKFQSGTVVALRNLNTGKPVRLSRFGKAFDAAGHSGPYGQFMVDRVAEGHKDGDRIRFRHMGHGSVYLRILSPEVLDLKGDGGRNCEFYLVKVAEQKPPDGDATSPSGMVSVFALESFMFPKCYVGFYKDAKPMHPKIVDLQSRASQFLVEVRKHK
tara:strand:+ start:184 stop:1326 length:1143 start_codon:yes stop_codon:yes gene_type:complete